MIHLKVEYDLVIIKDCLPEKQKVLNCSSKKAVLEAFDYLNKINCYYK